MCRKMAHRHSIYTYRLPRFEPRLHVLSTLLKHLRSLSGPPRVLAGKANPPPCPLPPVHRCSGTMEATRMPQAQNIWGLIRSFCRVFLWGIQEILNSPRIFQPEAISSKPLSTQGTSSASRARPVRSSRTPPPLAASISSEGWV